MFFAEYGVFLIIAFVFVVVLMFARVLRMLVKVQQVEQTQYQKSEKSSCTSMAKTVEAELTNCDHGYYVLGDGDPRGPFDDSELLLLHSVGSVMKTTKVAFITAFNKLPLKSTSSLYRPRCICTSMASLEEGVQMDLSPCSPTVQRVPPPPSSSVRRRQRSKGKTQNFCVAMESEKSFRPGSVQKEPSRSEFWLSKCFSAWKQYQSHANDASKPNPLIVLPSANHMKSMQTKNAISAHSGAPPKRSQVGTTRVLRQSLQKVSKAISETSDAYLRRGKARSKKKGLKSLRK